MQKHSQEEIDNLTNIAGCIIAAGIALQKITTGKRVYITEKLNEALNTLHEWGYSIKPEDVGYQNPKIPDYMLTENSSGKIAFKLSEGSHSVTQWYHHFTSY